MMLEASSRWGLLPFALALAVVLSFRLGAIFSRNAFGGHDLLRGSIFCLAAIVSMVRILGAAHVLRRETLFVALFAATVASLLVRRDRRVSVPWRELVSKETAPIFAVAVVTTAAAAAAAYLLPVWQWDALGYHLPYVNFLLQGGSSADVPPDVPYISTYPHVVEEFFAAWRAMLPDDRLLDAAQIPLGLLGAASIAVMARTLGARRDHAVIAGLVWITLPAVFLQLPTNYIDVGTAALLLAAGAFALSEPHAQNVVAAGVATGLLLGSKPNAPIATVLLFSLIAVKGWKAGRRQSLVAAAACIVILGTPSYLENIIRHGNPIWPVEVSLGPVKLPGLRPMKALLDAGCAAPRVHGSLLWRVAQSWSAFDAPPVFDMRYGGLGILFLVSLPIFLVVAFRRRELAIAIVAMAALASPDPAIPRYVLAFPGIVFAVAATAIGGVGVWTRRAIFGLAAAGAAFGFVRAYPGLAGEGPPLGDYTRMTESQRLRAVGADGSPAPFYNALERLALGEISAFDGTMELPYLAWWPDLSRRAIRIPDDPTPAEIARVVADPRVRLLMVDKGSPVAVAARNTDSFIEVFQCKPRVPPACLVAEPSGGQGEPQLPKALNQALSCVILSRR